MSGWFSKSKSMYPSEQIKGVKKQFFQQNSMVVLDDDRSVYDWMVVGQGYKSNRFFDDCVDNGL